MGNRRGAEEPGPLLQASIQLDVQAIAAMRWMEADLVHWVLAQFNPNSGTRMSNVTIEIAQELLAAFQSSEPDGLIRVSDGQIAKARAAGALAWKSGEEETTDRNLEDLTDGLRPGAAALLREAWWRGFMDAIRDKAKHREQAAVAKKEPR